MTASDEELAALKARLRRLEDESELREVLSKYGFSADLGLRDKYLGLFTEDAFIDIGPRQPPGRFEGREAIGAQFFDSIARTSISGHSQHHAYSGPMVFHIDGDDAVAEGYSIVYVVSDREQRQIRADHTFHKALYVVGVNFNRWTFRREDDRWKISGRVNKMLGTEESHHVFETTFANWGA